MDTTTYIAHLQANKTNPLSLVASACSFLSQIAQEKERGREALSLAFSTVGLKPNPIGTMYASVLFEETDFDPEVNESFANFITDKTYAQAIASTVVILKIVGEIDEALEIGISGLLWAMLNHDGIEAEEGEGEAEGDDEGEAPGDFPGFPFN